MVPLSRPVALIAVLAMLALAQPVLAQSGAARDRVLIQRGEALLRQHCALCHGVGRDDASRYPNAPLFRELSRRYPVDVLEEALAEGFTSGHPAMPEFVFSAERAAAIVAYLMSIQVEPRARPQRR
ncbi:c-type cytochrome [Phreatobacter sp.]|uniref:c-type cytochrome n=1 Tax=Phreatobacter sp. TaxID=1966341 RepID=UPI003F6F5D8C